MGNFWETAHVSWIPREVFLRPSEVMIRSKHMGLLLMNLSVSWLEGLHLGGTWRIILDTWLITMVIVVVP